MPSCQNCGAHVSEAYVRVFVPDGENEPHCCPACEDKVRVNGRVRPARSVRTGRRVDHTSGGRNY